ncbi:MAG: HTH-type transcriptional regulatory protein GabR [Paracidovorax wautersii]|uniref:HTH-type transcriptional regulatory protein GabR n=1 Tax=Paracidovorax wautersii TaxID=1177982 RepID=A0A7V8JRM0_9BURK|nr:MAG: HTH-type transcriptional regulatory protein GabR [Paracidovorax wautersii]
MDSTLSEWLKARLDEPSAEPSYRRLAQLLQQAILSGQLASGTKLPSSRALGADLGVARNTVTHVYEQLLAEGYVVAQSGSGTYVADTAPERVLAIDLRAGRRPLRDHQRLSKRGRRTIEMAGVGKQQWGAFMPGVPDTTEFPLKVWNRLQNRVWRQARPELMTYAQGGGYRPLRRALADYLRVARAADCQPEHVIVTTGIHQSVDLAIRLLCDVGDEVWVEDPCYWGVRNLLLSSGLKPVPIPVDDEGMNPTPRHLARPPRLIICTPSHQYPLGCVMSLSRRRMLLEYARLHDCWILEDDYDSEFRYGISPLASLQGLDPHGQVIYVSSFSKVLFPSMRVGYMVVPGPMADFFAQGIAELYREGQLMLQAILAEFIDEGYLGSHIRRMRGLYAERRELLIGAVRARYGEALPVLGGEAGLHLVLGLPHLKDDLAVSRRAQEADILTRALSGYYASARTARTGLILGYGCVPHERIASAFETLGSVIDSFGTVRPPA